MRQIKVLVIVAMTALAAMAIAGTSAASATELCSVAVYPCDAPLAAETKIEAKLAEGSEAILTGMLTVKCKGSTLSATTLAKEGAPLKAKVTALIFTGCTTCEKVESLGLPTETSIEAVEAGEGNGTETIGKLEAKLSVCPFGLACTAKAKEVALDVTGGKPAEIVAKEEKFEMSGGLCGASASFTATYKATAPNPLFVGPRRTVICQENVVTCPGGKTFPMSTAIEAATTEAFFEGFPARKNCANASVEFETTAASGKPLPAKLLTIEFTGGCGGCTVTSVPNPAGYTTKIRAAGAGVGKFTVENPKLKFVCAGQECVYEKPAAVFESLTTTPTSIIAFPVELNGACAGFPAAVQLWAGYLVSSPNPFFVTR